MRQLILILLLLFPVLTFAQGYKGFERGYRTTFTKTEINERDIINSYFASDPYRVYIDTLRFKLLDSLTIENLRDFFKQVVIASYSNMIVDLTGQTTPYVIGNVDFDTAHKGWYHADTSNHGRINSTLTTHSWTAGSISFGMLIAYGASTNKMYDMGAFYAPDRKIMILSNATGIIYTGIQSEHTALQALWFNANPNYPMIIACTRTSVDSTADSILINNGSDTPLGITYYEQHIVDNPLSYASQDIPITCLNYKVNPVYNDYVYYSERRIGGWWFGKAKATISQLSKINNCLEWYRKKIGKPLYYQDIIDTTYHGYDSTAWNFFLKASVPTAERDSLNIKIKQTKDSLVIATFGTTFQAFYSWDAVDSNWTKYDLTWNNHTIVTHGCVWRPYDGWDCATAHWIDLGFKFTEVSNFYVKCGFGYYTSTNSTPAGDAGYDVCASDGTHTYAISKYSSGYAFGSVLGKSSNVANTNSIGSYAIIGTDVSNWYMYKDGAEILHNTQTRSALNPPNYNVVMGGFNASGTVSGFANRTYRYFWVLKTGVTLTATQCRMIHNIWK